MWDFKFRSFLRDIIDPAPVVQRGCDIPGCAERGDFRAPKSRYNLQDYYWFCIEHVRQYNQSWDYFKGMSAAEVETHLHKATVWDRPTWRTTEAGLHDDTLRRTVYERFAAGESVFGDFSGKEEADARISLDAIPHPAVEALAVMGLSPPIGWEEVKARYKTLAKKHHPDTNPDDKGAEEQLKKINLAYSILRISYQTYTNLDEKK